MSDHYLLLHAVHRRSDTLQDALRSFHAAGIERITMLPDNGTFGPLGNTNRALGWACEEIDDYDRLCILQDDFVMCRDALSAIASAPTADALALFTPTNNVPHEIRDRGGWVPLAPSRDTWGGALLMPVWLARMVINHPNWRRHMVTRAERRGADAALFETLGMLDIPAFSIIQHAPSLIDHIGQESSTIGNEHSEASKGFRYNEWG